MSRSNIAILVIAACAVAAALWYRQQVFPPEPVLTTPKLAFVTGGSSPYWQLTAGGARAAAEAYQCELAIEMPKDDESLEQQMALLTRLKYEDLDGLALSPLDANGQTPLINRINLQTNVVTFDSDAPLSTRRGHVGTSNYGAGVLCAQLVDEVLPSGGKVIVLLANLTKENMIDRKGGFEETVEKLNTTDDDENPQAAITVADFMIDDGDQEQAEKNVADSLSKHSDLACIVGMNAYHGPVILKVLKAEDKLGDIKVVTFDEEAETLDGIEAGNIYATIAQDPYKYGYEAVRVLCSLSRKGPSEVPIVGGGTINITAEAIRQENLKKFRERLQARTKKETN